MKRILSLLLAFSCLLALAAWAVWRTVQRSRKGAGCCGEHEEADKKVPVADRNRAHYPYTQSPFIMKLEFK